MFGISMPELLLILAVALIILGPKKLPEIAKALGRGINEFRKATQDFKEHLEVDDDLKDARNTIRKVKEDIEDAVGKTTGRAWHAAPDKVQDGVLAGVNKDAADGGLGGHRAGPADTLSEDKAPQETCLKEPGKDA